MSHLNKIVRQVLLNEARGRDGTDLSGGYTDPAASAAAAQTYIDLTKSIGALALDTIVYFRSGQVLLDALTVMTPLAHAPKDEKETQTAIAATSLHTLLDNLGTAGLDAADVVNGGVYMLERNYKMAALCLVAAIPIVGSALVARKAGKFAIVAADVSKVDAKIVQIKSGLRAAETPGAEATIKEIEKLRADMSSGRADFNSYDQIPEARRQAAERVAADPEKLAAAAKSFADFNRQADDVEELLKKSNYRKDSDALGFDRSEEKAVSHQDYPDIVLKGKGTGPGSELDFGNKYPDIATRGRVTTDATGQEIAIMERMRPLSKISPDELFDAIRREFPEIPDDRIKELIPKDPADGMGENFMAFFGPVFGLRATKTKNDVLDKILTYSAGTKRWSLIPDIEKVVSDLKMLRNNKKFTRMAEITRAESGLDTDIFRLDNIGLDNQGNIKILDWDTSPDPGGQFIAFQENPGGMLFRGGSPPPIDDPKILAIVDQILSINGALNEGMLVRWGRLAGLVRG